MNIQEAVEKIKRNEQMVRHCHKFGGVLLFDSNSGDIYFCNEDERTYYDKWSEKNGEFHCFDWRDSGLSGIKLTIVYDYETGFCENKLKEQAS